jgi:hypothetical protein
MPQAPSRRQTRTPPGSRAGAAGGARAAHHFGVDDVVGHDLGHLGKVPAVPLAHAHGVRVQLLVQVVQQPDRLHDHRVHLCARALPAVRPLVRAQQGRASSLYLSMQIRMRIEGPRSPCPALLSGGESCVPSTRRHVGAALAPSATHARSSEACQFSAHKGPPSQQTFRAAAAQPWPSLPEAHHVLGKVLRTLSGLNFSLYRDRLWLRPSDMGVRSCAPRPLAAAPAHARVSFSGQARHAAVHMNSHAQLPQPGASRATADAAPFRHAAEPSRRYALPVTPRSLHPLTLCALCCST